MYRFDPDQSEIIAAQLDTACGKNIEFRVALLNTAAHLLAKTVAKRTDPKEQAETLELCLTDLREMACKELPNFRLQSGARH